MTLGAQELEAARSLLFVPVLERRFVEKAHAREAGAIILDLEDAIAPAQKDAARLALPDAAGTLRANGVGRVVVRVNAGSDADIEAAVVAGADAVLIPKVLGVDELDRASAVASAAARRSGRERTVMPLLVLVETPQAVIRVNELAAHGAVIGLVLGSEDLALALGVEPSAEALMHPAQQMVMAARAFGKIPLGVLGSLAAFDSDEGFQNAVRCGRRVGMAGAVCIHPKQVLQVNREFLPSESDLQEARRILEAFAAANAAGLGAVSLDGRMLDRPIVERAKLLLAGRC